MLSVRELMCLRLLSTRWRALEREAAFWVAASSSLAREASLHVLEPSRGATTGARDAGAA